jgi:hypothetical protein
MRTLPGASRCVQEQSVSDYGLSDQIVRVACIHFIFFSSVARVDGRSSTAHWMEK